MIFQYFLFKNDEISPMFKGYLWLKYLNFTNKIFYIVLFNIYKNNLYINIIL